MPGLNRKGPEGQGPKTGRGMGRCNPNNNDVENMNHESKSNFERDGNRRGMARGIGQGRGQGRRKGRNSI